MPPKFGTSGLRGLVSDLTSDLIKDYIQAFATACDIGDTVYVGWDLRPSSPTIAEDVITALTHCGKNVVCCGALPTPALAMAAQNAQASAVMITGSHIPADRNGLKFYVPQGEISKPHEQAITAALGRPIQSVCTGTTTQDTTATESFVQRYIKAFGPNALRGMTVGIYEHSSVARDIMGDVLSGLGAKTVALARSDIFIPVDTEAVDPQTRQQLANWASAHNLDAIVSTDGDGDRPMVADATGQIVPGDVLGPLTARVIGAHHVATPVSSNTLVDHVDWISTVHRTKIGSPFVIAAMEQAIAQNPITPIAGYEANGGFLVGFTAQGPNGPLPALMTRDSILPMVAPLVDAHKNQPSLQALVTTLPQRFAAADRLQGVDMDATAQLLQNLTHSSQDRRTFFDGLGSEDSLDTTDGLRVQFTSGDVVHLRPSGNAPEFRCYAEANTAERAHELVRTHLAKVIA